MKTSLLFLLASICCFPCLLSAGQRQDPLIEFITPEIVRVRWNPEGLPLSNATGVCVYEGCGKASKGKTSKNGIWKSDRLMVEYGSEGILKFSRIDGLHPKEVFSTPPSPFFCDTVVRRKVIYDDASARMVPTANGMVTVKDEIRTDTLGTYRRFAFDFLSDSSEALYGLGSHEQDYMDLSGKRLWLTQHNLKAFVPVLVSTKGYGLLFDAGSSMRFQSAPSAEGFANKITTEAANTLDFYFILGDDMQDVSRGYRLLTGSVAMMPRWAFGYVQSKERYVSSEDILNTVKEYRRRRVPLDVIVQDWNYWPQGWGYMKMNREFYPDPKALADSVHALDAKIMVSIWPNPQYCPEQEDFKSRGYMLEHSVYDAFNPEARDLYWQYADGEFFSNGFDAWWCDSSEPLDGDWNQLPAPQGGKAYSRDDYERRWLLNDAVLSETLGADRACLYSLYHAKGIFEHQRAASDKKRVVNLTRSPYAGQQRYATIVWNGDTDASWESFRRQIPAGLNYMATGCPYWTMDAGCFFTGSDGRWFRKGEFPDGVRDDNYKEFYTRMLQWGAFLPMMRSHGTDTPREIWNFGEPGTPYYDALLQAIRLRYSLVPYIYSMADMQTRSGYSMARPLAFDFPSQREIFDVKDQYMFGNIMVCPVTSPGVETRRVILPRNEAGWFDFHTGAYYPGCQSVDAAAPISRIPLFVKGGSIIPSVEPQQTTSLIPGKTVTFNVYPGADCEFTLYEDDGDGYDFEKGKWSRITARWDDASKTLTLLPLQGKMKDNGRNRIFRVSLPDGQSKEILYNGKKTTVAFEFSPAASMRVDDSHPSRISVMASKGGRPVEVMALLCGPHSKIGEYPRVEVEYDMPTGKRSHCRNSFSESAYRLADGDTLRIRTYEDGVAWKKRGASEVAFPAPAHWWLQEWTEPYEALFPKDRDASAGRFAYPALFEMGNGAFALLSESGITSEDAATSMHAVGGAAPGSAMHFSLRPDGPESGGWQTLIVGDLATIAESTLISDNSAPSRLENADWVRPGTAAWVYWAYNHGSNDCAIIAKYSDMAARLGMPYVLIDAEWDTMKEGKDGKTVEDAVAYALSKGVDPMIWYNSSIGWIDGAPTPKFRLNTPEDREREFAWCEKIGVKGVKIDFFSGDTNRNLRFMEELLADAARHHLLVNFHGATLPRGWQRTWPNFITNEGVYGAEWYNNVPTFTDKAASHNATLPFTRNVVASMDYTPCAFSDSQHPHITTHAHELALTVLFESGIQHIADRPESIYEQPAEVQALFGSLPTAWDDTVLIDGYPGEFAVIARRKGKRWYVAGINGSNTLPRAVNIDLSKIGIDPSAPGLLFEDGDPWKITPPSTLPPTLDLLPRGGFLWVQDVVK